MFANRFKLVIAITSLLIFTIAASAQQTFSTYEDYCNGMVRVSALGLTAMISGLSKAEAIDEMSTLTDPASIRMVKELIAFYYDHKQPVAPSSLRSELLSLCLSKSIFVP